MIHNSRCIPNLKKIEIKIKQNFKTYLCRNKVSKNLKNKMSGKSYYILPRIKHVVLCTLLLSLYLLLHFDDLRRKMNHILRMLNNLFFAHLKRVQTHFVIKGA